MTKFFIAAVLTGLVITSAAPASASIFINFDSVTPYADVMGFYDGGTDSAGASGPNLGVDFVDFSMDTGFGETSEPNFAVVTEDQGIIDDAAGFTGQIAFTQGVFSSGVLVIYSGLDGTGTPLATADLPVSNIDAFAPYRLTFVGVAESAVFIDPLGGGNIGIDDLRLGSAPEPASWALMLVGFGALGASLRSRRRAVV